MVFPELDHKEGWVPKNWCFWTVVLERLFFFLMCYSLCYYKMHCFFRTIIGAKSNLQTNVKHNKKHGVHPFGKSWASVFSLHHPEGYPIPHLATGKGRDKESDPAQHLSRVRSARESRTTWSHWRTRPGSPGIWSAVGTVCTGARCVHLRQPNGRHRLQPPMGSGLLRGGLQCEWKATVTSEPICQPSLDRPLPRSHRRSTWRRLFRVPWTARRSSQSILKEISHEYSLEGLML